MSEMQIDVLSAVTENLIRDAHLTQAERAELLRIAQGFACKDSAAAAGIAPETIRARRKRIYHKLGVAGAGETLAALLALALQMLGRTGAAQGSTGAIDTSVHHPERIPS